jgi:hypothetical protein
MAPRPELFLTSENPSPATGGEGENMRDSVTFV